MSDRLEYWRTEKLVCHSHLRLRDKAILWRTGGNPHLPDTIMEGMEEINNLPCSPVRTDQQAHKGITTAEMKRACGRGPQGSQPNLGSQRAGVARPQEIPGPDWRRGVNRRGEMSGAPDVHCLCGQ